jgi:hypothetical protein
MNIEKIEKLKKGLNSSHISDDLKAKIQAEINRLEKEDEKLATVEKKPRAVRKPVVKKEMPKSVEPKTLTKPKTTVLNKAKEIRKEGESWKDAQKRASEMLKKENQTEKELTKSEMKELLALINKNEKLKKLVGGRDINRDASRVSLPAGKRVSKDGNTYYENRINRTDRITVGKLSLAKGGKLSRVWSEEQSKKVAELDYDFEKEVEKQGIDRNSKEASDLWHNGGFKDRMYEIFKDNKEKGGSIPNNYEGKAAEEIWDSWSKKQRQHFLADHSDVMDIKDLSAYNKEFKDLHFLTQAQLELHIEQGQYADGGYLTDPTFGQFQAQVYSDGGEVHVYKGFHGLQAENYIDNVDGFDWNIITMKRHTGNLVSSATAGQSKKGKDGVVEIFTHDWDAPKINLITSKPSRVTEKVIAEQHKNALEIFKEKMTGKFEQGGNFDKPFNVIYKTKSGRGMVASNIMAKNEKEAEEKLKKQMRASSTFDSVIMVHESFEVGGILSSKERYVLEVKGQTGLSVGAIEKYIDDNNLSEGELLNIVVGLGRKQLKGADVATAVVGKPNNAISKEIIAFAKSDKAMKLELGGNVGAYDLAGHLGGNFNVGQNNGNLSGTTGTFYTGLVGETGTMSSGEMFELGGGVPSGLQGAVQTYTNAYANEGATAGMYDKGGKISKEYVPQYDIESVTVKKGKKQIVIKGSDVLNGANMLKKGGDLSKSATYFPKRDVVSVKLKNGEVVHPANGYWVGITPKMVRTQFEESAFEYKAGGVIKNQYEGKSAEKVWEQWNESQRSHFLLDHSELLDKDRMENNLGYSRIVQKDKKYSELTPHTQSVLEAHVEKGQYEDGGFTNKDGIKVRSVAKPEKELSEKEWMEKHSESKEARAYATGGSIKYQDYDDEIDMWDKLSIKQRLNVLDSEKDLEEYGNHSELAEEEWEDLPDYVTDVLENNFKNNTYKKGGKVTFAQKAKAISKNFEGKQVEPKYQKEYGKTYDKAEAKEVGNKIAGSQKAKYDSKMKSGGKLTNHKGNSKMNEAVAIAKKIRKDGEAWASALKRAWAQVK